MRVLSNRKSAIVRISSLVFCLVFIFLSGAVPVSHASELDDLKQQYNDLQKKIAQNEQKLKDIKSDKSTNEAKLEALNAQIDDLDGQMGILNSRIDILNGQVSGLNSDISKLENSITGLYSQIDAAKDKIDQKQGIIDATLDKIFNRMVANYMAGNGADIEILLSSTDMSTFFTRREYLRRLAVNDEILIDSLKDDMAELDALNKQRQADIETLAQNKKDVESKKADVVAKRDDVSASANELGDKQYLVNSKYSQTQNLLSQLDENSAAYKAQIERWQVEEEKTSAAIDAFIARQGSKTGDEVDSSNDGKMTWPVPYDNCYISAGFPTYPSGGKHGGIDICVHGGSEGKKIVAAQGGEVISAGWNGSYGNCIIIDHGGGLFTLYGHCSSLAVSSGQKVAKGQLIGYIGSTGNVTGPHLHFEVRVNSNSSVNRVQPLNYVSKP